LVVGFEVDFFPFRFVPSTLSLLTLRDLDRVPYPEFVSGTERLSVTFFLGFGGGFACRFGSCLGSGLGSSSLELS
jgi:hypothetical protein